MKKMTLLIVTLLAVNVAYAANDTTFSFIGQVGGGYVQNLSTFDYTPPGELSQSGFNGYARFLWSPEHLLDVGVEIGITHLYTITPPDSSPIDQSTLNAYPFYLVFSMQPVDHFYLTGGFGAAVLSSVATDATGNTAVTSTSTSVFLSTSYLAPVTENLDIGGEIRATSFDRYGDFNLSFNVVLSYTVSRY